MNLFDVYQIFDIEPAKARGCWVWDKLGNKYLDLYGGHAVISVGHNHPEYCKKISEQLEKIVFYSNSIQNPLQQELASKLGEISGYKDYQLFLCNSGAEAVENGIKVASFHTGRKKIICFSGAFHGRTSLAVATSDFKGGCAPVNETDNVMMLPWNDIESVEKAVSDEVACVMIEGIQGIGGIHVPDQKFLEKLRELCDLHGVCLLIDEIQSGYGRTGEFFAHQNSGVKADIITTAKGMGNGFPIGGVLINSKIEPKKGMLGSTFGGNHLACAAGIAVLDILKDENLLLNAKEVGGYLIENIRGISGVQACRGIGLMIAVDLAVDAGPVRKILLDEHKIFTGSSSGKQTLRLLPPLCVSRKEIDLFLKAFKSVLDPK